MHKSLTSIAARFTLYMILIVLAIAFVMPIYVMIVNSLKPLEEIRNGNLMALPIAWTVEPWLMAWSKAQIGVEATGLKPYFINSFLLVIPAVIISTLIGALNGYILTQFKFRFSEVLFASMLFSVFIPYQIVLIPMAKTLGPWTCWYGKRVDFCELSVWNRLYNKIGRAHV